MLHRLRPVRVRTRPSCPTTVERVRAEGLRVSLEADCGGHTVMENGLVELKGRSGCARSSGAGGSVGEVEPGAIGDPLHVGGIG